MSQTQQQIQAGACRIQRVSAGDRQIEEVTRRMVTLSQRGLPLMFRPQSHEFGFTRKRDSAGHVTLQGSSLRYGAIVALGALHLEDKQQRDIFAGENATEFVSRLIAQISSASNLGDVALVAWAAAELSHRQLHQLLEMLQVRKAATCPAYTVEAAWVLSALVASGPAAAPDQAEQAANRLLVIASDISGIFPHWTRLDSAPWTRRHVACFADQVYPIQALSRYARATGHQPSLNAARRCAEQICRLQGSAGQWWWHYDCRTGQVVEGYPVYTVHQDAMAPMALLDLTDAGGGDYSESIRHGLGWMIRAAEIDRCLIDDTQSLIWRKVTRAGPAKLMRQMRAAASRLHPSIRLLWLNGVMPPTVIDYESRPYHLGWILHTWLGPAAQPGKDL